MKILMLLGALLIQCAAAKAWSNDSYSEETYSIFGWISSLKRICLISLMFFGVILYYVPESRPHARRICYILVDLIANSLKSALCARESDYVLEKIKSRSHRFRYDSLLPTEKCAAQETQQEEDLACFPKSCKKSKVFIDVDGSLGSRNRKKLGDKQSKEHRQSRHRFRNSIVKDVSAEPCMEVVKPVYFYSDKLDGLQKYLQTNVSSTKHSNGSTTKNYAYLISGSPQEMARLEQKYEKDDVVIVQDPYHRVEYKERSTSMDNLSSKLGESYSENDGPTRDDTNHATDSTMEAYLKQVELSSIPEDSISRYSANKSFYHMNQFSCGDECCGPNGCSVSTADLIARNSVKNVLKMSRSMVASKIYANSGDNDENVYLDNYDSCHRKGDYLMKPILSSNRKVDFINDGRSHNHQRREEVGHQHEITCKLRRRNCKRGDLQGNYCCKDVSYLTDKGGEADDENSQFGTILKDNLDERPEKEHEIFERNSGESVLDYVYEDIYSEPMFKNRLKPVLLRAVNWIFGGCPKSTRKDSTKDDQVGKEENRTLTDEWLL